MRLFLALLFSFNFASALTIKSITSDNLFEGQPLLKSTTLTEEKTEVTLQPVSHGLRKKAIFGLVAVNVYTLQLLAAKPEKLVKTEDGILASLKEAGPVQLNLTFLRNLKGDDISKAFREGLEANKLDVKNLPPDLNKALDEISAIKELKKDSSLSLTFQWTGDKSTVSLVNGADNLKSINGGAALADQLLSIWFGKPADAKMGLLKKDLIK